MICFKQYIQNNIGISEGLWKLLEDTFEIKSYKKGDVIAIPNDIWTKFMFINSGLIRSYIINDEGKEFTRQFYFNTDESRVANLFVVDLTSFSTNLPSKRGFEVLEDSEVIVCQRDKLYALYEQYTEWNTLGRKIVEFAYIDMEFYFHIFLTKSPLERYMQLKKTMSKLIDIAPHYHVASYLGITPVSLSRIRKKCKEEEFVKL